MRLMPCCLSYRRCCFGKLRVRNPHRARYNHALAVNALLDHRVVGLSHWNSWVLAEFLRMLKIFDSEDTEELMRDGIERVVNGHLRKTLASSRDTQIEAGPTTAPNAA